jgi:hypothetical protein
MSTFTKQAAKAARNVRAEIKRTTDRVALIKHPAVKAAFESFPPAHRKYVDISLSMYGGTVYISTTMRDLASFKEPKLTRVLERFMGDEWKLQVNEYTYDAPNKDFRFERNVGELRLNVAIYAFVKSDSPLCRIVVTGVTERVVREETKQIVCA